MFTNRNINLPENPSDKPSDGNSESKLISPEPASIKVLVIDDDEAMQEVIGYALEDLATEFDIVASGEKGLAMLDEKSYDLVFLDLVLHTGAHGVEIYHKIVRMYAGEAKKRPEIILMTASGSKEPIYKSADELVRSNDELASFILRKPFSFDKLEQIIEETKRIRRESGSP